MEAARVAELDRVLQSLAAGAGGAYAGTVYRILTPRYANRRNALSGEGALYASGRFHVQGTFRIAYTGCTLRQAEWEFAHTSRNHGIAREDCLPLTTLSAAIRLSKVLGLSDRVIRRLLKVTKAELIASAWNPAGGETTTQAIGRFAQHHGFEAVLTPSAGPDNNLNLLPENYRPGSSVQIINEHLLPSP